jgi:hypothetical protein
LTGFVPALNAGEHFDRGWRGTCIDPASGLRRRPASSIREWMIVMSHTNCVYYPYPLDANGDSATDSDVHLSRRSAPEEEPADEDPGHRPLLSPGRCDRRHRPWAYYQC